METKTEEKEDKGCPDCNLGALGTESLSEIKTLSHPPLCMRCEGEYYIQPDGPDAGRLFACGIMVENIEAGNMSFACCYLKTTPNTMTVVGDKLICKTDRHLCLCQPEGCGSCGKIIDADKMNESLRDVAALKPAYVSGTVRAQMFRELDKIRAGPHTVGKVR